MQKQCQLCRSNFDCKDSGECWCWNPEVKEYLDRIPAGTEGCICKNCLTHLAEKPVIAKKKQDYVAGSSVAGIGP